MIKCPFCGVKLYCGYPLDESGEHHEKRMAEERARGIYWTGGCMPSPVCPQCDGDLTQEDWEREIPDEW